MALWRAIPPRIPNKAGISMGCVLGSFNVLDSFKRQDRMGCRNELS